MACQIVLSHHEYSDGTGYPLRVKYLPIEVEVVAVCDSFYEKIAGIANKQMKVYNAIEFLRNNKDTLFNKEVVETFLDFITAYPTVVRVITNEGEEGMIIRQNHHFPERPVILIQKNANGNRVEKEINMIEHGHIFIDQILEDI